MRNLTVDELTSNAVSGGNLFVLAPVLAFVYSERQEIKDLVSGIFDGYADTRAEHK